MARKKTTTSSDDDKPTETEAASKDTDTKEETKSSSNGGSAEAAAAAAAATQAMPGAAAAGTAPRFQGLGQYIKDLSVENPNAPASLRGRQQPKIDVNVSVSVNPQEQNINEVVLKLEAKAGTGKDMLFAVELAYGGLFRIENMTPEQTQVALMIEGPRLLFPFAREILANATRQAGFPPLMLDPVDFLSLYRQRAMQAQQAKAS